MAGLAFASGRNRLSPAIPFALVLALIMVIALALPIPLGLTLVLAMRIPFALGLALLLVALPILSDLASLIQSAPLSGFAILLCLQLGLLLLADLICIHARLAILELGLMFAL